MITLRMGNTRHAGDRSVSIAMEVRSPMSERIKLSEEEWRERLTPEQFEVTRRAGTERAFAGKYTDCKEDGIYRCVCCGTPLYDSQTKYNSGSGWPSFW